MRKLPPPRDDGQETALPPGDSLSLLGAAIGMHAETPAFHLSWQYGIRYRALTQIGQGRPLGKHTFTRGLGELKVPRSSSPVAMR